MASSIDASTSGAGGVITTADNTGILQLKTAGTTAVTIDTSQNVGIGTTTTTPTNGRALIIYETTYPRLTLRNSTTGQTSTDGYGLVGVGNDLYVENAEAGNLAFTTSNTERMRIDSSGNVLVNTTSAFGSGKVCIIVDPSINNCILYKPSTNNTFNPAIFHNSSGTQVGFIQSTASATSYSTSSDYRLKENIVPMTGALATVQALKPVTYKWKIDGSDGQGFIAHELQEVVPDCVSGEKDAVDEEGKPVHQGVDTSFLVATLTAAIQEQQTIINDLKARVTALEAK